MDLNRSLCNLTSSSVLDINQDKSLIYFSRYITYASHFYTFINICLGAFQLNILGIPLKDGNLIFSNFSPLSDKNACLACWLESKVYSYGERLQLIKSLIKNYLAYWLRAIAISEYVLKKNTSIT